MVHVSIVEDDSAYGDVLEGYLSRYQEETGTAMEITRYASGMDFLERYSTQTDVVLMDIEMPVLNGLETARSLRRVDPLVVLIFVTATAQYAVHGYSVNALDYIVKPIRYSHFSIKLGKALQNVPQRESWYMIPTGDGLTRMACNRIYYVEASRHHVIFHTAQGDFPTRMSISSVEQALSQKGFSRPGKSFLLNLQYVQTIRGNQVVLRGKEFSIGRSRRASFMNDLTAYLGGRALYRL